MTTTKRIEHSITRQLLQRRDVGTERQGSLLWAERLIAVLAVTAGLMIVGSYVEEVLWLVLAVAAAAMLR